MTKRIFVALSGGVDSSVSAYLLKKKGYSVCGVYMRNWDVEINENEKTHGVCVESKNLEIVQKICEILEVPLYVYNFVPEYWEYVFEDYIDNLKNNLNTNPDISCNSKIKFGVLLESLENDFGEDIFLATGHWAKIVNYEDKTFLGVCKNTKKDQTYFLSSLTEKQLSKIIFPLENICSKEEVRQIAKDNNLPTWDKKDSTGICFIGKRNYQDFISKYIQNKKGKFVDIETGKILGEHQGTHLYVLHQRSGLFLKGYSEKYYVCGKDLEKNVVFLCRKEKISEFLHKDLSICIKIHLIVGLSYFQKYLKKNKNIFIKTRHSPVFLEAYVEYLDTYKCVLRHKKTYVTSPGQSIVFYDINKEICFGNGMYIN